MFVEKASQNRVIGEEIEEYYDGENNIGISINTYAGEKVYTYGYYDKNELLIVEGLYKIFCGILKFHLKKIKKIY